jgi:hypothetical protein
MARCTQLLVIAALAIVVSPAWAQKVHTDVDPSVNFATLKTYYWVRTDPSQDDLTNRLIVAAVNQWLTEKGWVEAPEEQAQVAVVPHVTTQQKQTLNALYNGLGPWAWGGWGTATLETYTEGALIIDLFGTRSERLIWRGTATDTLADNPGPEKVTSRIQKAAEKMFRDFPPGSGD